MDQEIASLPLSLPEREAFLCIVARADTPRSSQGEVRKGIPESQRGGAHPSEALGGAGVEEIPNQPTNQPTMNLSASVFPSGDVGKSLHVDTWVPPTGQRKAQPWALSAAPSASRATKIQKAKANP